MSLTLYYHPLSSFCQKVVVALHEKGIPFEGEIVDLSNEESRAAFLKVWPIGKFPVIRDRERKRTVPESSIIIEYLDLHFPGTRPLLPADPALALEARLRDRFYDLAVEVPMQKIITDRLRPAGKSDPFGVEQAHAALETAYDLVEAQMAGRTWAVGEEFGIADCAAAPALFYANHAHPIGAARKNVTAYLERLLARPSYARALEAAKPYFANLPK